MIDLFTQAVLWSSLFTGLTEGQILANGQEIPVPEPTGQDKNPTTYCGNSTSVCPSCNGQVITNSGSTYRVYCDTYITWNTTHRQSNVATTSDCMQACNHFSGCAGILTLPDGTCELATSTSIDMFNQTNYTVLLVEPNPASSSQTTVSLTPAYESAYPTMVPATSQVGNSTDACQIADISCPGCDGQTVTDEAGRGYRVLCDNQMFADVQYTFPHSLSPEICLAHCDNSTSCHGATFWPEGNCEIAQGSDAAPQSMLGYTAFIPLGTTRKAYGTGHGPRSTSSTKTDVSTTETDLASASSTSSITGSSSTTETDIASTTSSTSNPDSSSTTTTNLATSTSTSSSTSSASTTKADQGTTTTTALSASSTSSSTTCDPLAATCPACDSYTVNDKASQQYLVQCSVTPPCSHTTKIPGHIPQAACLQICDYDPQCLAVIQDGGDCELCNGPLGDTATPRTPSQDYIVFLLESPKGGGNGTWAYENGTSSSTWTSRQMIETMR